MASPLATCFAGIATVVTAMGAGFTGALLLTDTLAIEKDTSLAFSDRQTSKASGGEEPPKAHQAPKPAVAARPHQGSVPSHRETTGSRPFADTMWWIEVSPGSSENPSQALAVPEMPASTPGAETPAQSPAPAAAVQASPPKPSATGTPIARPRNAAAGSRTKPSGKKQPNPARAPAAEEGSDRAAAPPETIRELPNIKAIGAVSGNAH